jgi:hypothetical protein
MVLSEGGRVPCMFVHESALTHVGTKKPTAERSHKPNLRRRKTIMSLMDMVLLASLTFGHFPAKSEGHWQGGATLLPALGVLTLALLGDPGSC